jgi:hypothetical protein
MGYGSGLTIPCWARQKGGAVSTRESVRESQKSRRDAGATKTESSLCSRVRRLPLCSGQAGATKTEPSNWLELEAGAELSGERVGTGS